MAHYQNIEFQRVLSELKLIADVANEVLKSNFEKLSKFCRYIDPSAWKGYAELAGLFQSFR